MLLVFPLLLTYLAGCSTTGSGRSIDSRSDYSVAALLTSHSARQTNIHQLTGRAAISFINKEERGSVRQAIAIASPNKFRFEIFSVLGIGAVQVCNGKKLAVYYPRDGLVYRGRSTPENLARFTRTQLSARQIARLLLGFPPFELDGSKSVSESLTSGLYQVEFPDPGHGTGVVWFNSSSKLITRWAIRNSDGTQVLEGEFKDYRRVDGQSFPYVITLRDRDTARTITIQYKKVSLELSVPDSTFVLHTPDGVTEIDLDA